MFSKRLIWDARPNRLSEALDRRRRSGMPVLDLTESNPTRAALPYDTAGLASAFADPRLVSYEPSPIGASEARKAVAVYYTDRGQTVDAEHVLLTASTSESYSWLFKLLADPGDEVLVPRPSYPLFDFLAALEGVRGVQYPLTYNNAWKLDVEGLRSLVTPYTRAVILVNPNNPTGSFLKADEWTRLVELCRERNLALICDEVFADYSFSGCNSCITSLADRHDVLTFSLSGLSKVAGLPQVKLGWMVVSGPEPERRQAWQRLELIADTYLSVGTPVQLAAPALLESRRPLQAALCARLTANLNYLRTAIAAHPAFELLKVEGGWYATLRVPRIRTEEEWVLDLLENHGVLVQPGFFYDFESEVYLILSLMTPEDTFAEGCSRLIHM